MNGFIDDSIQNQRRLLSHGDPDFEKTWEIAQSMETAHKDVCDMQVLGRVESVAG